MPLISDEAKEVILEKIEEFAIPGDEWTKRQQMRSRFVSDFSNQRIRMLTASDYFPGEGKKENHIGYQLEWATRSLGSIKGGSMAKYGSKDQFVDIKKLLIELTSLKDEMSVFYELNRGLTEQSKKLIAQSQNIKGMKSGCTVLGKLLSIYYPRTFIPIFTDQGYFLRALLTDYSEDSVGLESFMKNNLLFLQVKEELLEEPAFIGVTSDKDFINDFLFEFLYFCFHSTRSKFISTEKNTEEERIEALETIHYQKLIHRNFQRLFKSYTYADEESQNKHEGHYSAEDAGIMDFLCLDKNDDFLVIELKRKGTDKTLAQLCRYMGWVKENLANKTQKVFGLIVSESKDIKLEYAIKVVPNVKIKRMNLNVAIGEFD